jgi:ATP-dependent Clp protease ATP-binding subunit ClpA
LKDRGLKLEVTPAATDLLVTEGYDPQYGARPMRRAVQRLIQDPLALKLINGEFGAGDTVVVDKDGDALRFERRVLVAA